MNLLVLSDWFSYRESEELSTVRKSLSERVGSIHVTLTFFSFRFRKGYMLTDEFLMSEIPMVSNGRLRPESPDTIAFEYFSPHPINEYDPYMQIFIKDILQHISKRVQKIRNDILACSVPVFIMDTALHSGDYPSTESTRSVSKGDNERSNGQTLVSVSDLGEEFLGHNGYDAKLYRYVPVFNMDIASHSGDYHLKESTQSSSKEDIGCSDGQTLVSVNNSGEGSSGYNGYDAKQSEGRKRRSVRRNLAPRLRKGNHHVNESFLASACDKCIGCSGYSPTNTKIGQQSRKRAINQPEDLAVFVSADGSTESVHGHTEGNATVQEPPSKRSRRSPSCDRLAVPQSCQKWSDGYEQSIRNVEFVEAGQHNLSHADKSAVFIQGEIDGGKGEADIPSSYQYLDKDGSNKLQIDMDRESIDVENRGNHRKGKKNEDERMKCDNDDEANREKEEKHDVHDKLDEESAKATLSKLTCDGESLVCTEGGSDGGKSEVDIPSTDQNPDEHGNEGTEADRDRNNMDEENRESKANYVEGKVDEDDRRKCNDDEADREKERKDDANDKVDEHDRDILAGKSSSRKRPSGNEDFRECNLDYGSQHFKRARCY